MKYTLHFLELALFATVSKAVNPVASISATFDTTYDNPNLSLSTVTCSDGKNGLITKGYSTIGDLPTQDVGGAPTIKGWNDVNCGACYALTYDNETVYVMAIDVAVGQFNLALKTLNKLTHGHAQEFGSVVVQYEEVDKSKCGL